MRGTWEVEGRHERQATRRQDGDHYWRRWRDRTRGGAAVCSRRGGGEYCRSNQEGGAAVASEISRLGGRAIFERADVTCAADCRRVVERTVKAFGGVHVLFNNAGMIRRASIVEISEADWDAVMAVNVNRFSYVPGSDSNHGEGRRRFDCEHGFGMGLGGRREGSRLLRFEGRGGVAHESPGD